ncbi:MAG: DUF3995 domain-containing protein [Sphingomonadales bacterium]|nr:DUF3995 domain-containing protein [Sphingomonadales bacterium]
MMLLGDSLATVFFALAALHLYWALGGRAGLAMALPADGERPAFTPGRAITFAVTIALLACGSLLLGVSGLLALPVPASAQRTPCILLAGVLALRAIGDRKWLGFTKRRKGSRFARWDTWVYSPLCCVLALGIVVLLVP